MDFTRRPSPAVMPASQTGADGLTYQPPAVHYAGIHGAGWIRGFSATARINQASGADRVADQRIPPPTTNSKDSLPIARRRHLRLLRDNPAGGVA